jgi:hypothetical protein
MGRLTEDNYSFSHSEMATYKQCKRKWMMQYYWKLRRKREPKALARDTGIVVHEALHLFYTAGGLRGEYSESIMDEFLTNVRDEDMLKVGTLQEDPETVKKERKAIKEIHETARILCNGYIEWLKETGADIGLILDKSEVELRAPGPVEGTEIMGIIDLGGTDEHSGDLIVMDTKVTASIDEMLKTLHIQEQGPMYAVLAKINDPDETRGFRVIWNMIKRNKQTARAKPPFYQRYELAINGDQLRQFYAQLQGQIEEILRTEDRLNAGESHIVAAYPTPTPDCSWKCQYFTVCGAMNDMTRNDVPFLINTYFSTPEQREAAKVEEAKNQRAEWAVGPDNTEEGS